MDTLHNDHICTVSSYRSNLSGHTVQAPNPENSESAPEQKIFCAARRLFSPLSELVLRHAPAVDCYEKFQKLLINLHVMFARLSFII